MNETKRKEVKKEFSRLFESDPTIKNTYKKIASDKVITYEDANRFSKAVGRNLAKTFKHSIDPEELDDVAFELCEEMLHNNVTLVNNVCHSVQDNLNRVAGVGIKPVAPSETMAKERITRAVMASKESGSIAMLTGNTETLTVSVVDSWIRTNAEFQHGAGLEPIIVREWDGVKGSHDTKNTDLCESWAGVYKYGTEPKEIYSRHVGCGCVVTYYPDKRSQGRITALSKGEKDTAGVLYNTGSATSNTTRAIRERMKRNKALEDARKLING